MNFAALQRFAPLIGFASKTSSELSDTDLATVASALAGDGAADLLPFLTMLREKEPAQRVSEILASDTAKNFFADLKSQSEGTENVVFAKCPGCGMMFETELK